MLVLAWPRRRGQEELEAAAGAGPRLELDPAAEGDRELARDREAEPGTPAVAREEGTEDPLPLLRTDPGPGVGDADRDGPVLGGEREIDATAVGRPAEGVRDQVGDDLEHTVPVGDDHRLGLQVAAVVDRAAPSLLAERGVR